MGRFLQLCAVLAVSGIVGTVVLVRVAPRAVVASEQAKATAIRVTIFLVWAILIVVAAAFGIAML